MPYFKKSHSTKYITHAVKFISEILLVCQNTKQPGYVRNVEDDNNIEQFYPEKQTENGYASGSSNVTGRTRDQIATLNKRQQEQYNEKFQQTLSWDEISW